MATLPRFAVGILLVSLSNVGSPVSAAASSPSLPVSTSGPSMLGGRAEHTATRLFGGAVLVTGGTDGRDHGLATTELFDPRTNRWVRGAVMNSPRVDHTATLLVDGRVLVTGGFNQLDQSERTLASTEIFDSARNHWTPAAPMIVARARHTATLLANGSVLVVGGYSAPTPGKVGGFATRAEVYDPQTNRWTETGFMGTGGRQGHSATRLMDGRVLVAGGEGTLGGNPSAEIYNPASNSWAFVRSLLALHVSHTATLLETGRVLIIGGAGSISPTLSEPKALDVAEIYDPSTDNWSLLRPMHTTRDHHTATLLLDGRVLVVGGAFTSTPLPELYDLRINAWDTVPGRPMNPYGHTATLLDDGRILIVGGYSGPSLASVFIYDPAGRSSNGIAAAGPPWFAAPLLLGLTLLAILLYGARRRAFRLPSWPSRPRDDAWIDP